MKYYEMHQQNQCYKSNHDIIMTIFDDLLGHWLRNLCSNASEKEQKGWKVSRE